MTDEEVADRQKGGAGTDTDTIDPQESEADDADARLKEAVEVQVEDVGSLRKKITITVPAETIAERRGAQFDELKRDAMVPGFRRGRAPLKLIEKRFGSDVGDQLATDLLSNSYLAAIEKKELSTVGDPLIWVQTEEERIGDDGVKRATKVDKLVGMTDALEKLEVPREGPWTYSCEVELRPEFELPELDNVSVQRPPAAVTDEMIESETERLRTMRGRFQPVETGPVEPDDMVIGDIKMTVAGGVIKEEPNVTLAARPQRLEGVPLDTLGEKLTGSKVGDTVSIEGTIPDDHENLSLRGQQATFDITVRDIKRLELPPLDGDFLQSLGCESLEDLRGMIRGELEAGASHAARREMRDQIRRYLLDKCEFELPAGLSQRQTDRTVVLRTMEMYRMGMAPTEIDKRADALRAVAQDEAVNRLKLFFIMDKIGEALEIAVTEEELNGAIASIARRQGRRFDRVRDELSKERGLENLYIQLRDEKILDSLLAKADIKEAAGQEAGSAPDEASKQGGVGGGKTKNTD